MIFFGNPDLLKNYLHQWGNAGQMFSTNHTVVQTLQQAAKMAKGHYLLCIAIYSIDENRGILEKTHIP